MLGHRRNSIIACLIGGMLLGLFGCKSAKIVTYFHTPSRLFYSDYNIDHEELGPFKTQGLVFVVDAKEFRHGEYVLWLEAYSRQPSPPITISKIQFLGGSHQVDNGKLVVDTLDKKNNLYKGSAKLLEIAADELDQSESPIVLRIEFGFDGDQFELEFPLQRETEKQTVFPT